MPKKTIKLCYCYAEKDEALSQELSAHLALLERQGILESWHAGKIRPGELRDDAIAERIDQADIILLLISADFLASSKCYDEQMARSMKRHQDQQAIVIPVMLRAADYTGAPFAPLAALPRFAEPIASLEDHDQAWTEVAKSIRAIAQAPTSVQSKGQRQHSPGPARHLILAAAGVSALAMGGGYWITRGQLPLAPPGMIAFLGGTVTMGSTHNPADTVRTIKLRPFALDIDEVTNEQFAAWLNCQEGLSIDEQGRFVSQKGGLLIDLFSPHSGIVYTSPGYAPRPGAKTTPVVQLTHAAAQEYCKHQHKRLPGENEWELAARGLDLQRSYPWGNEEPSCAGVVFERAPFGLCQSERVGPAEVGSHASARTDRTPEGIFDLGGNVAEWVHSTALGSPGAASSTEAVAPRRIVRGGDWSRPAASLRGQSRSEITATQALANVGFRCAADLP